MTGTTFSNPVLTVTVKHSSLKLRVHVSQSYKTLVSFDSNFSSYFVLLWNTVTSFEVKYYYQLFQSKVLRKLSVSKPDEVGK
jgi:hypothetical protein